jgi:ketosteroid isomerase-like protein
MILLSTCIIARLGYEYMNRISPAPARNPVTGRDQADMDNRVIETDQGFFDALARGDAAAVAEMLVDDFTIVDVMSGAENPGSALIGGIESGVVAFQHIEVVERRAREYGDCAIVTGRTRMKGTFASTPFAAHSRYTHVFIRAGGRWKMAAAQGTPVAD